MITDNGIKILEYDKILKQLASHTLTTMGKEAALSLFPKIDLECIKADLAITQEAVNAWYLEKDIPISGTRDLRSILKRASLGIVLDSAEFMAVYNTLLAINSAKKYLSLHEEFVLLSDMGRSMTCVPSLEKSIEKCLDDNGNVRDDASKELRHIRSHINILKNRVRDKLDDILRSPENQKYFQEQLVTMRGDRYVIPIKQEYRQFFPGIVHDQSSSRATLFIEPLSIVNINNDIKKLILDERQEVERILTALSKEVGSAMSELTINTELLGELDLIFAKAKLAVKMRATQPELTDVADINIRQGRHPLIKDEVVVPLDIHIPHKVDTLLITGPNTGGKTVSLKLVGLFVLMAQSGLFIPAANDSTLPLFSKIFADIGDEQSIEQSLSTFSGHMSNIINIINQLDCKSLVLLDELCAGTDPSEGAALAISILLHMQERSAKVLVSTHYNELKIFALQQENMLNACVEFDKESLSPKYRIIMGIAGSSNAFYISSKLGLSEQIIKVAQGYVNQEQARFSTALDNLEQEQMQLAQSNREMQVMREQIRVLQNDLARERKKIQNNEKNILDKAREEADNIKRRARREVEEVIESIKQLEKEKNQQVKHSKIKQAREALSSEWVVNKPQNVAGIPLTMDNIVEGASVLVSTLGQVGKVISWTDKNVYVQIGSLKTYVKNSDCLLVKRSALEQPAPKERTLSNRTLMQLKNFRSELDIRGLNVEEATVELDKYIDDALIVNMPQVRIIHGKGTGLLKKGVLEYLANHRSVKSFYDAPLSEGGSGATIICF